MEPSVTLNNGTILKVGKTYKLENGNPFEIVKILDTQYVFYLPNINEVGIIPIDLDEEAFPYTAPQEEVKWKTFLIEVEIEPNKRYRRFEQYKSIEDAKYYNEKSFSIKEVEIDIRPVNRTIDYILE